MEMVMRKNYPDQVSCGCNEQLKVDDFYVPNMDAEETLKHDKEARQWLAEIESFRSPPPPRRLFGSALISIEKSVSNDDLKRSSVIPAQKKQESCQQTEITYASPGSLTYNRDSNIIYAKGSTIQKPKLLVSANYNSSSLNKSSIEELKNSVKRESRPVLDNLHPSRMVAGHSGFHKSNSMTQVNNPTTNNENSEKYSRERQFDVRSCALGQKSLSGVSISLNLTSPSKKSANKETIQDKVKLLQQKLSNYAINGNFHPNDKYISAGTGCTQNSIDFARPKAEQNELKGTKLTSSGTSMIQRSPSFGKSTNFTGGTLPYDMNNVRNGSFKLDWARKAPVIFGSQAHELQQHQFLKFEAEIERKMESAQKGFGYCSACNEKITSAAEATQALGQLYHASCFTCYSCGRALTGKKFYEAAGNTYCEEDYLFSGYQQSTERCAVCGHFIMDMILQAVDKSFHPACFRCSHCKKSLDGVPFTMDDRGSVYCVTDYHRLFAPKCAKCRMPITPPNGRDETVRVVAMQKDYHVDCYTCEGCCLQLTDEEGKRCYPLGDHLLCQACHLNWSLNQPAVGLYCEAPITDV